MAEIKKSIKNTKTTSDKIAKKIVIDAAVEKLHRRSMVGIVVSDKMMKTRVVKIERQVKDGKYGKYITKANKFKIHDENNISKVGDMVSIVESRPLSREKRWALQKIIRASSGAVLTKI